MRSCNHKILLFIEVSLFPEFSTYKMSTSDCVQWSPFELFQGDEKSLLTITVQFVRRLVDFSGKLVTDIVAAGRRGIEFLRKLLMVVFGALTSSRFRLFLGIVVHGVMRFLSACFMALLFNDISFLLQNDKTSIEQTHGHILLGTDISQAVYSVLMVILVPYWTWISCKMADLVTNPAQREVERKIAQRIHEELQSLFQAEEALRNVNPNLDAARRVDPGSGMGASSPIIQDMESGGRTSTPMTTKTFKTFQCIFTLEEKTKKVSIELLQRFGPDLISKGSKVLYKRFEINTQQQDELANYISQIVASMRLAHNVDEDCFLQLGSSAIFKYTAAGPKMWFLQEDWTPAIIDISRQWRLFDYLLGHPAKWIIRGFNLQGATIRVASKDTSEDLVLIEKRENRVDIIICEEPPIIQNLASTFQDKLFISAFKIKEVEEGVSLKLQSEAKDVQRAYLISVVRALTPGRWITMINIALSFLSHLHSNSRFGRKCLFSIDSNVHADIRRFPTDPSDWMWMDFINSFLGLKGNMGASFKMFTQHTWETHKIWTHLWTGLEIYISVYLVYLFLIAFIMSWKLLLPAPRPPQGRQLLVSFDSPPSTNKLPTISDLLRVALSSDSTYQAN